MRDTLTTLAGALLVVAAFILILHACAPPAVGS